MKNKQVNFNIVRPEYQRTEFINFCNENQFEIKSLSEVIINELSSGNKNFSDTNFSSYGELFDFCMTNFAANPLGLVTKTVKGKQVRRLTKSNRNATAAVNRNKVNKSMKKTSLTKPQSQKLPSSARANTKGFTEPSMRASALHTAAKTNQQNIQAQINAAKQKVDSSAFKNTPQAQAIQAQRAANRSVAPQTTPQQRLAAMKAEGKSPSAKLKENSNAGQAAQNADLKNGAGSDASVAKTTTPKTPETPTAASGNPAAKPVETKVETPAPAPEVKPAAKIETTTVNGTNGGIPNGNAGQMNTASAVKASTEVKSIEAQEKEFMEKAKADGLSEAEAKKTWKGRKGELESAARKETIKKTRADLKAKGYSDKEISDILKSRTGANKAATGDAAKPAYERQIKTGVDAAAARYQNMLKAVQKARTPEEAKALQKKANNLRKAYVAQFNATHKRQLAGFHSDVDQIKRFGFGDWWKHNPLEGTAKLAVPGAAVAYGGYKATGGGRDE